MPNFTIRHSRVLLVAALTVVAGVLALSACSSEDPPDLGTLAVAVTPATINVAAGGTATATLALTRGGAFTGPVTLSQSGAPTGITLDFRPGLVPGGSAASTIAIAVNAAIVPGSKIITISAAGENVTTATVTLTLIVTPPSAGSFSLLANPTSLSPAGGAGPVTSDITVTRTAPFTGAVGLSVTVAGSPAGITASIDPPSVPGNVATLSVSASTTAVSGTYTAIVHGSGSGVADATAEVEITVSTVGNFTATFCPADAPIWVAAQDGAGAWTRVLPSAGNTYTFTFASGKGGFAVVDTIGTGTVLNVTYGTPGDLYEIVHSVTFGGCGTKVVNGTVANVGAGQVATITLGSNATSTSPALPAFPAFVLNGVASGPLYLGASRADVATGTANKIILRRAVDVRDGQHLAVLNFNAAEAFVPATANVSVTGLGSDEASIASVYVGFAGTNTMATLSLISGYTTGAVPYAAIPASALPGPELQQLVVSAGAAADAHFVRLAGVFFKTPTDRTIAMGPLLNAPNITKLVTGPNAWPQLQLASQSQYDRLISAYYDQATVNRSADVFATSGYFGSLPSTWTVPLPDLSAVEGWNTAWIPRWYADQLDCIGTGRHLRAPGLSPVHQ